MTNQEAAREFEDTLGLDSCLIGVKYSDDLTQREIRRENLQHVKLSMSSEKKRR